MNEHPVTPLVPEYRNLPSLEARSMEGLVLGTAGLAGIWGPVDSAKSVDTLLLALEKGVTAIDTAPAYSEAERLVGLALRQWHGKRPIISTKAGKLRSEKPDEASYDFSPEALRRSVYASLETMHIDHLDVLFLHDPAGVPLDNLDGAIATLCQLRDEGLATSLGIGGNYPAHFQPFITPDVFRVFMGYNRFNAVCQEALSAEYPFLRSRGIKLWQASPLFMGLLGSRLEAYQLETPEWIPTKAARRARQLQHLAEECGLTLPEVSLRYLRSSAVVDRIVIGASNRTELLKSLEAWQQGSLPLPLFNSIHHLNAHDSN